MRKMKSRRGVFVVLFGILFVTLMGSAALAIDFSRIWAMRNELQTSADAAALAGAVQITRPPNNADTDVDAATRALAAANLAMGAPVVVDSVILGNWTDTPAAGVDNWTPLCVMQSNVCVPWATLPSPVPAKNAVRTVVSHGTSNLIMGALGISAPVVHARSTAWADAPVPTSSCIKPWSIPYSVLMSKLNAHFGVADTYESLTRAFDMESDMEALRVMDPSDLTFTLKQGAQGSNDPYPDGTTAPGNFQRVQLPKFKSVDDWNVPGTEWPDGNSNGTSDYADAISGSVCHTLEIGDSLATLPGNAPEPTLDNIVPNVCASIVNNNGGADNGNCINAQGGVGVDIKAAFHQCIANCNGMNYVEVKMLGSFTLMKVFPNRETGPNPDWERGTIQGVFKPITANGPIGPGPTLYTRIILVK